MSKYSKEIKAAAIAKMQAPHNKSIPVIEQELNIPQATLYAWRAQAKRLGMLLPDAQRKDWDAASKLNCIIQTASLNQSELSAYCREHGLYPEEITGWRAQLTDQLAQSERHQREQISALAKQNKQLQKELTRKDKALAESAALLVLSKKYHALWEDEAE